MWGGATQCDNTRHSVCQIVMTTRRMVYLIPATAPGAALKGGKLAGKFLIGWQFNASRIDRSQEFQIKPAPVQFGNIISNTNGPKGLPF